MYARANYAKYDGLNGTSSSQTQSTSHNGLEGLTSSSYVASWNALFGPSVINDLNLQYARNDVPRKDKGLGLPEIRLGGTAPRHERPRSGRSTSFRSMRRTTASASATRRPFSLALNMIKIGGDYNDTGMDGIFKDKWRWHLHLQLRGDFESGFSTASGTAIHRVSRAQREHGRSGGKVQMRTRRSSPSSPRTSGT